jgi:hypothetical protein
MKTQRYYALFVCIAMASFFLLSGCAPVISQMVLNDVDQALSFEQLLENPSPGRHYH